MNTRARISIGVLVVVAGIVLTLGVLRVLPKRSAGPDIQQASTGVHQASADTLSTRPGLPPITLKLASLAEAREVFGNLLKRHSLFLLSDSLDRADCAPSESARTNHYFIVKSVQNDTALLTGVEFGAGAQSREIALPLSSLRMQYNELPPNIAVGVFAPVSFATRLCP